LHVTFIIMCENSIYPTEIAMGEEEDPPKSFAKGEPDENRETFGSDGKTEGNYIHDESYDDYERELHNSDNDLVPSDNADGPVSTDENVKEELDLTKQEGNVDPNVWTLPAERTECTLEEIRRGQVINGTAPNECPVLGCGKKINEMRAEPSPGTIASGLRTHVLFVHYANRKVNKKRKLGWSTKRRNQNSPKKQVGQLSSPSASEQEHDSSANCASNLTSGLNLVQKSLSSRGSPLETGPGALINQKVKQIMAKSQAMQMSSLHSLMQATGAQRISPQPKQKAQDTSSQKNFNPTTSSLFSILAGLTQQQQQQLNQPQPPVSRNIKTVQGTNTINISQCSRNPVTSNLPVNSSLLSLLNEKISGNVATSLQTQLKKSLGKDSRSKISTAASRQNVSSSANSYYPSNNNDTSFNNNTSMLSGLCSGTDDTRLAYDNSIPLNSFIESIAVRTGSNIGPSGIAEAKKIVEKFTTSLICSSQTIADHYLAPYVGDAAQQKPEISPSDVVLAYKMMHKSHGQP